MIEESDDWFTGGSHSYLEYFTEYHLLRHYWSTNKTSSFIYIKLNQHLINFNQNQLRAILTFIKTVKNLIDYASTSNQSFVNNQLNKKWKNQHFDIKTQCFDYALVFDYHDLLNSKFYIRDNKWSWTIKPIKAIIRF